MTLGAPGTEIVRLLDQVDAAEFELSSGQASKGSASNNGCSKIGNWSQQARARLGPPIASTNHPRHLPGLPEDLRLVRDGTSIDYLRGIAAGRPVKQEKMVEGRWEYHRNRIVV